MSILHEVFKKEGIHDWFPIRDKKYFDTLNNLKKECKSFRATTLLGAYYLAEPAIENTIDFAKGKEVFELLVMDSISQGFKYRYAVLEPTDDPLVLGRNAKANKSYQKSIKFFNEYFKNDPKKFMLNYSVLSPFGIHIFDDYMLVNFFGVLSRGVDSPTLMLKKTQNSLTFQYFEEQYENLKTATEDALS